MTATGLVRPHTPKIAVLQRAIDAGWIILGHVAAWAALSSDPWSSAQTIATCVAVAAFQLVVEASDLYQAWRGVPLRKEVLRVILSWSIAVPVLLLVLFMTKSSEELSRIVTTAWFVITPIVVTSSRAVARVILARVRASGRNTRAVAIVGMTETGETTARRIHESPWLGMRIAGFYDDRTIERCHPMPSELGSLVGCFDDLLEDARKYIRRWGLLLDLKIVLLTVFSPRVHRNAYQPLEP